jgi:hypothetical protein
VGREWFESRMLLEEEKSTSEPEREALLRCLLRTSGEEEEGGSESFGRLAKPEERMEMLDDFVRLGRWKSGFVEGDGSGGGAERGVLRAAG